MILISITAHYVINYSVCCLQQGFQSIEPATGATVGGALANMASVFTWNCDPTLTGGFCNLMGQVDDGTQCYSPLVPGIMYPCNAANVFIPKVQGGKVTPVWWIYATPDPGDVSL